LKGKKPAGVFAAGFFQEKFRGKKTERKGISSNLFKISKTGEPAGTKINLLFSPVRVPSWKI